MLLVKCKLSSINQQVHIDAQGEIHRSQLSPVNIQSSWEYIKENEIITLSANIDRASVKGPGFSITELNF